MGGLTERKAFKHFGEELTIICQQEPGLKYWGGSAPSRKILGGLGGAPAPPASPFLYLWYIVITLHAGYDFIAHIPLENIGETQGQRKTEEVEEILYMCHRYLIDGSAPNIAAVVPT